MSPFVKLREPSAYVACKLDLTADDAQRAFWCDFFKAHIHTILGLGVEAVGRRGGDVADARERAARVAAELAGRVDAFAADPRDHGRVTIFTLDRWREEILRRHGFDDCFVDLKRRENDKMLPLVPSACQRVDRADDTVKALIEGVFAGNIFDLGASATAAKFRDGSPDFHAVVETLKPRPWLIDDLDAFAGAGPYKHVVYFVDNAGSDILLGALPLARHFARQGTRVTLAANERPALNDVTAAELRDLLPRVIETEPSFDGLPIHVVSTGTGEPLIDLLHVSDELNAAAADADLVILEGMGRGVESNLDCDLACDRLNLAMLKDRMIAESIGGELWDCVCRFVPAGSGG